MLVGLFLASRNGEFARVEPTLRRLIGRPPMTLRDIMKAAIALPGSSRLDGPGPGLAAGCRTRRGPGGIA
jgi:hypothetical protein